MTRFMVSLLYAFAGLFMGSVLNVQVLHGRSCWCGRILFFLCCRIHGPGILSAVYCLFLALLLAAAFIDGEQLFIPDQIPCLIALLSIICGLSSFAEPFAGFPSLAERFAGCLACGGLLWGLRLLTHNGIGLGDVKLMAACGLFLGPARSLLGLFGAYVLAGFWYALPLLLGKVTRKTQVPMAPFFCAALTAAVFGGDAIVSWYMSLIFLP